MFFETNTSKTDWARLARQDDKDIDTSDVPELDEDFFRHAELRVPAKQTVTIRPVSYTHLTLPTILLV